MSDERTRLGPFELAVLIAVLRLDPEAYGVSIRREVSQVTGREVSVGAVYTTLDRMREKGLVTTWTGDPTPERGGRAKKFFAITGAGRQAVVEEQAQQARVWSGIALTPA